MGEIARYVLERLATIKVAALVALLITFTFIIAPIGSAAEWGIRFQLVALPTIALRLWDDLADREYDRRAHSERVLSRAMKPARAFVALVVTLLLVCLASLAAFREPVHTLVFLLALIALGLVYASELSRRLRSVLVLLKYPVIVMLGVPSRELWQAPGRLAMVLSASWLCVFVFDTLEERLAINRKP